MSMDDAKRFTEAGEIWVCGGCGKAWQGDRYDAPDVACFMYTNLCKLEPGVVWESGPGINGWGRVKDAEGVDYDWTAEDWKDLKPLGKQAVTDEGAEPSEAGAPETT